MQACYTPFLEGKKTPHSGHVDYNVFGIWPFEMYRQTGNEQYLKLAKELSDEQIIRCLAYQTNKESIYLFLASFRETFKLNEENIM